MIIKAIPGKAGFEEEHSMLFMAPGSRGNQSDVDVTVSGGDKGIAMAVRVANKSDSAFEKTFQTSSEKAADTSYYPTIPRLDHFQHDPGRYMDSYEELDLLDLAAGALSLADKIDRDTKTEEDSNEWELYKNQVLKFTKRRGAKNMWRRISEVTDSLRQTASANMQKAREEAEAKGKKDSVGLARGINKNQRGEDLVRLDKKRKACLKKMLSNRSEQERLQKEAVNLAGSKSELTLDDLNRKSQDLITEYQGLRSIYSDLITDFERTVILLKHASEDAYYNYSAYDHVVLDMQLNDNESNMDKNKLLGSVLMQIGYYFMHLKNDPVKNAKYLSRIHHSANIPLTLKARIEGVATEVVKLEAGCVWKTLPHEVRMILAQGKRLERDFKKANSEELNGRTKSDHMQRGRELAKTGVSGVIPFAKKRDLVRERAAEDAAIEEKTQKERQALIAAANAHRRYPETYQEEFELSAKMVAAFLDIYDELSSIANQQAAKQSQSSDSDGDRPSAPKAPKPQFRLPAQAPGFSPTKSVDSSTSEWTATDSIGLMHKMLAPSTAKE